MVAHCRHVVFYFFIIENKMVDFSMVSNIVQSMGWDRSAEQKALVEAFAGK